MAKFSSYYNLCPLTDIKGLQGVSTDGKDGHIIVTYRRNLAINYRVIDQRQVHSWRTKENFLSPVVWCEALSKYFAAFGQRSLRCWIGNEEYLDKNKKIKFGSDIKTLLSCNGQTYIVFCNGSVLPLPQAISQRKERPSTPSNRNIIIQDVIYSILGQVAYIGLVISDDSTFKFRWSSFDSAGIELESNTFELDRHDVANIQVVGSAICALNDDEPHLLLLWSDGRMFSVHLRSVDTATVGEVREFSGRGGVAMITVAGGQYVALFGEAAGGDGSLLGLYSVHLRRLQTTQPLKLRVGSSSGNGGGLWCCGEANQLLVHVGQNLVVVPFHLKHGEPELAHILGEQDDGQSQITNGDDDVKLQRLLECNDTKGVMKLLPLVIDLQEATVVQLLQFTLSGNGSPNNRMLMRIITHLPVNDDRLIKLLRKSMQFDHALMLLHTICLQLAADDELLDEVTREKCILWAIYIIDANYQELSLSSNSNVFDILSYCNNVVKTHLSYLNKLQDLSPCLTQLLKKHKDNSVVDKSMLLYSIETIQLY